MVKNRMNILIMPAQATDHKIPDLETSSRILQKSSNKNDELLKEIDIWYASRLATALSPPNPFTKQNTSPQDRDILKSP